jgi:hypothetical protein
MLDLPDPLFAGDMDDGEVLVNDHRDVSSLLTGFNPFTTRVKGLADEAHTVAKKTKRLNSGGRQVVASTAHALPSSSQQQERALGRGVKRTSQKHTQPPPEPSPRFFDDTEAMQLSRIMGLKHGVSNSRAHHGGGAVHGGSSNCWAFRRGSRREERSSSAVALVDTTSLMPPPPSTSSHDTRTVEAAALEPAIAAPPSWQKSTWFAVSGTPMNGAAGPAVPTGQQLIMPPPPCDAAGQPLAVVLHGARSLRCCDPLCGVSECAADCTMTRGYTRAVSLSVSLSHPLTHSLTQLDHLFAISTLNNTLGLADGWSRGILAVADRD